MKICDIKAKPILPFEIKDVKLIRLFSFYLHSAPTVNSRTATQVDKQRLLDNWENFKRKFPQDKIKIFSRSCSIEEKFKKYGLSDDAEVNRRMRGIVCKRKNDSELKCYCLLRHIRNSIAHNNVYISNAGNRKYILFEDFSNKGNISAKILFSQTDLTNLKKEIMK